MIETFSMFILELILCLINVVIFIIAPNVFSAIVILVLAMMALFFLWMWFDERKPL